MLAFLSKDVNNAEIAWIQGSGSGPSLTRSGSDFYKIDADKIRIIPVRYSSKFKSWKNIKISYLFTLFY